jgi:hypothetical protein
MSKTGKELQARLADIIRAAAAARGEAFAAAHARIPAALREAYLAAFHRADMGHDMEGGAKGRKLTAGERRAARDAARAALLCISDALAA